VVRQQGNSAEQMTESVKLKTTKSGQRNLNWATLSATSGTARELDLVPKYHIFNTHPPTFKLLP